MSSIAVPASIFSRRRIPWVLVFCTALAIAGVAWLVMTLTGKSGDAFAPGQFYTVVPMDMDITISKDGDLQAVNNVEIINPVEGQNVILDIAKEGQFVHKGDVVCKIDSADLEHKIENAQLDLQKSESDLAAARESKAIQESTNAANLEAANVELILARLDYQQYVEGTFPSSLKEAKTNVEMSKITVKNKEDDLDQTRSLFSKGFVTAADVKTAELALLTANNDLDKKTTDLMVMEKYAHEKDLTDKRNKVAQAEKKFARTQRENASNLAQKNADLQAKEQSLSLRKQLFGNLQRQLAACTIKAPGDGMVVYASSSGGQWGRRETPIQPGAQIRQQELLIRLPDTSAMKAVCRINEQQVSKLRVDPNNPLRASVKIVGQPDAIGAWLSNISIMADSSQRWWNPDSKDYPVDVTLDHTPAGLKPGVSVEVKIFVDRLRNALAVPLGAVYAVGPDSYVFVRSGLSTKPLKVSIGQINDIHAQVLSGLSAGQNVLILQVGEGRDLLEKAGIKVVMTAPTTQPIDIRPPIPVRPPQPNAGGTATPGGTESSSKLVATSQPAGVNAGGSSGGTGGDSGRRGGSRGDRPPRSLIGPG